MDWLRIFLAPGSGPAAGDGSATTLSFEGIDPGWALIGWLALAAILWWSHARLLPAVSRVKRTGLVALRLLFAAVLLFVAARPVLVTTIMEKVRQTLLVLVDDSASMDLADLRSSNEDRARALIAAGKLAPEADISQPVPASATARPTRREVLREVAANPKLDLWRRLDERAELTFVRFGGDAVEATATAGDGAARAKDFFKALSATDQTTALGESLRQVLDRHRGEPLAGVLVMTDGANNRGLAPAEAAAIARADGVPLFLYGVGVTEPRDVKVISADAPRLAFLNERVNVRVVLSADGFGGQSAQVVLRRAGEVRPLVDQAVMLPEHGTVEAVLSFSPDKVGELTLEAAALPLPGEAGVENNATTVRMRVVDNRVKVFMIEQEPRWDWRYLVDFIQDDRRLALKCVLLDGDPSLQALPNTPFLPALPEGRAELYGYDVILLGDVDPARLGAARMQAIRDWVDQAGGGLVFLAGPNHNPFRYVGTPLEALLPVVPAVATPEVIAARRAKPVKLALTAAGARSPLLRLAERDEDNAAIWRAFEGVRWTARVARARPGAEVLLVDPSSERPGQPGAMPVLARQRFGRGEVIYVGFNETYRWRSDIGGKHYAKIWGQMFQALSLERLSGASKQVQLRVDRPEYQLGERVVISGRLYQADFRPFVADVVPARAEFSPAGATEPVRQEIALRPVPDEAGGYRAEFAPSAPGHYQFFTLFDPTAKVEFDVVAPRLEQADAAMNLGVLKAMADAAGGRVLREENLHELPRLLDDRSGRITSLKRIELAYSPVLLALLLFLACAEWLVRRLNRLK